MINHIINVALEAGEIIKSGANKNKLINYKGSIDMVTEFDVKAEALIIDRLSKLLPDYEIVAEESAKNPFKNYDKAIYIDPIDGTTNFIHGFPFVSVSIGVYNNGEGEYGVVYNPITNEMFYASKNNGAFLNGNKIYVSDTKDLQHSLCATGFPYNKDKLPQLMAILEKTLASTRGIRRAGSAALDLCYTAKGVFDLYYETSLKPWDIAAGMIILSEAGGKVTDMIGGNCCLTTGDLIASNGIVHNEFMHLINL